MEKIKKTIIVLLIGGLLLFAYDSFFKVGKEVGNKEIYVEIIDKRNKQTNVILKKTYKTNKEILGEFLDEISGDGVNFVLNGKKTDQFGRLLKAINDIENNSKENQYWTYESKNNRECVKAGFCDGIDRLPIYNLDKFTFSIQ